MAAGRYSAGRIFLQVVPSFRGVQRETAREVKKLNTTLGDEMEKGAETSGRRAGRKAGGSYLMGFEEQAVKDQQKLNRIWVKVQTDLQKISAREFARARREQAKAAAQEARRIEQAEAARLKKLGRLQAAAYAEDGRRRSKAAAQALAQQQAQYAAEEKALRASMARRGGAARREIEKAVKAVDDSFGTLDLASPVERELDKIRRKVKQTSAELSGGIIDADQGRRQIERLGRDIERVMRRAGGGINLSTRGNMRQAIRDINDMSRALDDMHGRGNRVSSFLRGISGDGNDGANAFRIFNYRILAVAVSLPLLIPLLAAAAGGLAAFGSAALGAGAGLGVMLLAFSGVGDAVKALGDVQENAAKDSLAASKTMRNAARGVRDAQQGLAQARLQAARSAEDSNRRIADAERRLADQQREAKRAQDDLREARRRAQQDQEDLAARIKAGKLDERQALIDLFEAQTAYNAGMASGGTTNLEKEQLSIALERARLALANIRGENKEMAAEQARYAKQGVNASAEVQAAQERVRDSQEGVRDAERDLADARREAREQAVDNARAIRDAQERLTDAQAAYTEAVTQTGDLGSASMQKLEQAMGKLSPAGRAFALYLHSLRDDFYALRAAAQEGMLPGLMEAMEELRVRYGPGFERFVGTMAKGMGDFFLLASKTFTSPIWENFFAMMERNSPIFGKGFGEFLLNTMTGIAGVMIAFEPLTLKIAAALVDMSESFAQWGTSLKDSETFQRFLGYLEKTGPKVWELLKQIVRAFVAIGVAFAPYADKLLDFAIAFFGYIADMDPQLLGTLVGAVLGFVLASQLAAGATQLWLTLATPFHSVIGAIVFLLVGLGLALFYAYTHWDGFREVVDNVIGFIKDNKDTFIWLAGAFVTIGTVVFGAFKILGLFYGRVAAFRILLGLLTGPVGWVILGITLLVGAFIWAWQNVEGFAEFWKATWDGIVAVVMWVWNYVLTPYFAFLTFVFTNLMAIVKWVFSIINPILELFGAVVRKIWEKVIGPVLGWIGGKFTWLRDVVSSFWYKHIDPILDKFGLGANDLKKKWETALGAIGAAWEKLKTWVWKPMDFIVNTVINKGFVDNFNKLAKFFGTTPIKRLSMPALNKAPTSGPGSYGFGSHGVGGYATGGYTGPGSKYQPAGIVHADEFVIRKEATNRIRSRYGLDTLEYINRFGELPGMAGYASGGLVYKQMGAWVRANLPGKVITSDYRPGAITALGNRSMHSMGLAVDIGPPDMAAFNEIKAAFGRAITQLFYSPAGGQQVLNGRNWYSDPVTRRGHWDHIHWAMRQFGAGGGIPGGAGFFDWFASPINFLKKAVNNLTRDMGEHQFAGFLKKVPLKLINMAADKIGDMVDFTGSEDRPAAARPNAGQFHTGGLVPHNGTMMYDNGGYLPPGITQVVNLTGRPEPVFTGDQWDAMETGGRSLIGSLQVDVNGSDVTAGDVVDEIMWQVQRVEHGGKYAGLAD